MRKSEKPKIDFSFWFIFLIPGAILYFIITWRFSSAETESLKENLQAAEGTIISGHSYTSRRFDFTEVTVQFYTKEGEKIVATEDIDKYDFKKFYNGQVVKLVYSKTNPQNIDLLISESNVRELTGSEERDISVQDLLQLLETGPVKVGDMLNKMSYGWELNKAKGIWVNEKRGAAIEIQPNEIVLVTTNINVLTFPRVFVELGFRQTTPKDQLPFSKKPIIFEKAGYTAVIKPDFNTEASRFSVAIMKTLEIIR